MQPHILLELMRWFVVVVNLMLTLSLEKLEPLQRAGLSDVRSHQGAWEDPAWLQMKSSWLNQSWDFCNFSVKITTLIYRYEITHAGIFHVNSVGLLSLARRAIAKKESRVLLGNNAIFVVVFRWFLLSVIILSILISHFLTCSEFLWFLQRKCAVYYFHKILTIPYGY